MAPPQFAPAPKQPIAQRPASPAAVVGGRRKVVPGKSVSVTPQTPQDLYYGFEDLSKLSARFIVALFACPATTQQGSASGSSSPQTPNPSLANFVAYAIHRTRLPEVVVFTALFLLSRLKERFPAARGSSGHRLFISAFMIASKVICDDTYSNKSWCIVGQNLYTLKEVNQMEREMCSYLEWVLHVEAKELKAFEDRVRSMYGPDAGANPPAWVPMTSTATVQPTSAPAPLAIEAPVVSPSAPLAPQNSYPSPVSSPPTPSHSDSTSPASSVSCLTPPSGADQVSISGATGSASTTSSNEPLRTKVAVAGAPHVDPSFAFASSTVW